MDQRNAGAGNGPLFLSNTALAQPNLFKSYPEQGVGGRCGEICTLLWAADGDCAEGVVPLLRQQRMTNPIGDSLSVVLDYNPLLVPVVLNICKFNVDCPGGVGFLERK